MRALASVSIALFVLFLSLNLAAAQMKRVEFTKERITGAADISELAMVVGKELPNWYTNHFVTLSGLQRAEVASDEGFDFVATFESGGSSGDHITDFLTVDQVKQQWPYIDYLEEYVENYELSESFVEWQYLVPLAGTGDGTLYVALGGKHNKAVYEADNGDNGIGRVADDIDELVSSLGLVIINK